MIFLMSLLMRPPCLVSEISFMLKLILCILQQSDVLYGICNMSHLWDLQMYYGMVNPLPIILGKLLGELIRGN
jgi:hypothetical protein